MRYAYYMKADVDKVWKMEVKEFYIRLKHMEAVVAEDRYITQTQIDNHLYLNNKKTISNFQKIYKDFANCMKSIDEVKTKKNLSVKDKRKIHEENLATLGLKKVGDNNGG